MLQHWTRDNITAMDSPHITSTTLCSVVTKLYNTCTYFVNDPTTFRKRGNFTLAAADSEI